VAIKNYIFYEPIIVTATSLREAKEELELDLEVDPRITYLSDVRDGFVKFLKTTKSTKEDVTYYKEKQAEIAEACSK